MPRSIDKDAAQGAGRATYDLSELDTLWQNHQAGQQAGRATYDLGELDTLWQNYQAGQQVATADTGDGDVFWLGADIALRQQGGAGVAVAEALKTALGRDTAVALAQGVMAVPRGVVGLADLATAGQRNMANNIHAAFGSEYRERSYTDLLADVGVRFADANSYADAEKSDELARGTAAVQEADGFWGTTLALTENPRVIWDAVVQSAPSMVMPMGITQRAAQGIALTASRKAFIEALEAGATKEAAALLAREAAGEAVKQAGKRLAGMGAAVEGVQASGEAASKYEDEGDLTGRKALASVGAGLTTAAIGRAMSNLPGLGDAESHLAASVVSDQVNRATGNVATRLAKSALQEGVLEEMSQSATEKMWENAGNAAPIMQGVDKAAALGMLTGASMGGGLELAHTAKTGLGGAGRDEGKADSHGGTQPAVAPSLLPAAPTASSISTEGMDLAGAVATVAAAPLTPVATLDELPAPPAAAPAPLAPSPAYADATRPSLADMGMLDAEPAAESHEAASMPQPPVLADDVPAAFDLSLLDAMADDGATAPGLPPDDAAPVRETAGATTTTHSAVPAQPESLASAIAAPGMLETLRAQAGQVGWAETGGRVIRDENRPDATTQIAPEAAVATVATAPIAPVIELQDLPARPARGLVAAGRGMDEAVPSALATLGVPAARGAADTEVAAGLVRRLAEPAHGSVEAGIVQALQVPPQSAMRPDGTLQIIGHPAELRAYLNDIGMGSVPAVPFTGGVIIGASAAPQVYAALRQEESSSHSAFLMESDKDTVSPQAPLDAEQVRVTLGRRLSRMGDVAEVVQSLDDLPAELRSLIKGITGIEGIFFRNKIWLIADGLASLPRAQEVLEHEVVGHFAMEKLAAQDEYQQAIRSVAAMEKSSNALVRELATFIDAAQPGLPPVRRIQEIMARAVETGVYRQSPLLHRVAADVTRQVKAILRRMGFEPKWTNKLTIEEVFSLLREGDRRVDAGLKAYSGRLAKLASTAELELAIRHPVDGDSQMQNVGDSVANRQATGEREAVGHQTRVGSVSASQILEQIRNASDIATADLDGDPEAERQEFAKLGPFAGYLIYGEVVVGNDHNLEELLYVRVYGDEQLKQGLLDEAALTFFVSPSGEVAMNGPSPTQDTFASFKQLGWVDHAFDAAGVVQDGWSSLADPLSPGAPLPLSQMLPLLADVHARLRTWRRKDAVELFWSSGTGTVDSFEGANELLGNGASLYFSKAGPQSAYHETQADTVAVPATIALPDAIVVHDIKALQGEEYLAAKRGDAGAAMKVATRLLTTEVMEALRSRVQEHSIVLGLNATEEADENAIPQTVAALLALRLGVEVEKRIVRSGTSKRPAIDSLSRVFNPPGFAGPVQTGMQYVVIDDALPQDGTLGALARHIQQGGGQIAAIVALNSTGYDYQNHTASEARYLTNYKSADAARYRILAEARQRAKPTGKSSVNEPRKAPPQGGVAVSKRGISLSNGARFGNEGGNGLAQKTGPSREAQRSLQKSTAALTGAPHRDASSLEHHYQSQAASPITFPGTYTGNALATHWIDRREARILRNANRAVYPNRQVPRGVMIDLAGLSSALPNARYVAMQSLVDCMQRAAAWGGYSSGTSTEPWDGSVSITPISAAEQQQVDRVAESFIAAAELTNASIAQDGLVGRANAFKDLRKQMRSLSQNQQAQLVVQLTDQIAVTDAMRGWYGNIGWKADQAKFEDSVQVTGTEEILAVAAGAGALVGGSMTKDMASLSKVATAGVASVFGIGLSVLRRQAATGVLRLGQINVPNSAVDAAATAPRVSSRPEWLQRLDQGNTFNAERSAAYPYNEVYINSPKGSGYTRLDSYNPTAGEIVSRKFTQLSEIQEQTAVGYINELTAKYPVNATIARVPSSGNLAGQPLLGQHYLEVPIQLRPIPQSVLDTAERSSVLIRDINGRIH